MGRLGWGVLVGLIALLAAWVLLMRHEESAPDALPSARQHDARARVLAAVPGQPVALLMIDMAALRQTELGQRLFSAEGRQLPALGSIQTLCGFDPMSSVTTLVVALPRGPDVGFGLHADGPLSVSTWQSCAEKLVREHEGSLKSEQLGAFRLLRDTTQPTGAPVLAVAEGGPLIFAPPSYVQDGLAVAAGKAPSAQQDEAHRWLREHVAPGDLVATAVMTPRHRALLEQQLPMKGDRAYFQWRQALLGVSGAAASLQLGDQVELRAVLRCDEEGACVAAAVQLQQHAERLRTTALVRTMGLAEALDGIVVRRDGAVVHVALSLSQQQLLRALKGLMLALRGDSPRLPPRRQPPAGLPPASGGLDPGAVDGGVLIETIKARPDAGIE